ncbi:MAG: hypothetical protein V3U76_14415 [Granulosicoccus sp.]
MFEFLFNQPLPTWQEAELFFASGWPVLGLLLSLAVAALLTVATLLKQPLSLSRKAMIALLQLGVMAVLLTMLWQPVLRSEVTLPGDNSVAWLLDVSASMDTADEEGVKRRTAMVAALRSSSLLENPVFEHSLFTVGEDLQRLDSLDLLPKSAKRSAIADALETQLAVVNESSLAAIVLMSDGSDNTRKLDAQWWQSLAAAGVPIHTIGIGALQSAEDIELVDVSMTPVSSSGSVVTARLVIRHGLTGSVRLRISTTEGLLFADDLVLSGDATQSVHEVSFNSGEAGVRQIDLTISHSDVNRVNETNMANNSQQRMLEVRDERQRILYVEGEPRWEYKFLRRALHEHPAVEIVSLLRTSPNKFYRQGVRGATELADGFPSTREALFAYDAVIIGSLETAQLDTSQQAALRDFVSVRGGSLLMLAGRQGLADGGWARSVVSAALPVVLDNKLSAKTYQRNRTGVQPTVHGLRTDWLQFDSDSTINSQIWSELPDVADWQSTGQPKPGALVLLETSSQSAARFANKPVLVWQRYGQGASLVLGTSGTWRWQMGLPASNDLHERFWRNLLSQLVATALPRMALVEGEPIVRDVASTDIAVMAYNADYSPVENAVLLASLEQPDGVSHSIELFPDLAQPGRYRASVPLPEDGPYALNLTTLLDGEAPTMQPVSSRAWWIRESGTSEAFAANQQRAFLERIANATGGQYLSLASLDELQVLLENSNAALKREQHLSLWNMPFFFFCLFLLKGAEWLLRLKWKRL